jgi:uncharacterized membrane protein
MEYEMDAGRVTVVPRDGLVTLTHVMYALHGFSAFMGIISPALIVTSFLTGWPSIIAIILNYVKRGDVRGTYLESHFRWQVRTFWFAVLWVVIIGLLILTFVGIIVAIPLGLGIGIWVLYRIIRGWLTLAKREHIDIEAAKL